MKIVKALFKFFFILVTLSVIYYVFNYITAERDHVVHETVVTDTTIPRLTINDYSFHLETFGNSLNPLLIVLHGGPGLDYRYLYPLKSLSDTFFVVFYDQRGSGLSQRVSPDEINMEIYMNDLDTIARYFGNEKKINLIGHSWGAVQAVRYISMFPERVNKVVLAEPDYLTTEMAKKFMEKVNFMRPGFSFSLLNYTMKSYFQSLHIKEPDNHAAKDYFFYRLMMGTYDGHPLAGFFCQYDIKNSNIPSWRAGAIASQVIMQTGLDDNGGFNANFIEGINAYKNEVLFLTGECNTISGPDHQLEHAGYFPKAKVEIVHESGHYMIVERPHYSLSVIREYFTP